MPATPVRVVRRLGDRAGDVGAVALVVVRVGVVVDEVPAGHEVRPGEVGRLAEAAEALVGDSGVDDRDHDRGIAPGLTAQAPSTRMLPAGPGSRSSTGSGRRVVRRDVQGVGDPVRVRVAHARIAAERVHDLPHATPGHREHVERVPKAVSLHRRALAQAAHDLRRLRVRHGVVEADDDAIRHVLGLALREVPSEDAGFLCVRRRCPDQHETAVGMAQAFFMAWPPSSLCVTPQARQCTATEGEPERHPGHDTNAWSAA